MKITQKTRLALRCFVAVLPVMMLVAPPRLSAQVLVLDDFSSGNIAISNSVSSSDPVPGVFGGWRTIQLNKERESSETFLSIGSGALTWNKTEDDTAWVTFGTMVSPPADLSRYSAFRITVISGPTNAGALVIHLSYSDVSNRLYSVSVTVDLPASGVIEAPFAAFVSVAASVKFPPLDFTK